MAGASCARALADRGVEAVVYDKGKVAGGRLAARWAGQSQWDYGAQYLTARDDRFRRVVDAWSIEDGRTPTLGHWSKLVNPASLRLLPQS